MRNIIPEWNIPNGHIASKNALCSRYEVLRQKLVRSRVDAGLTQVALAARLNKGQSFVSKIETGERYVDVMQFVLWCEACGVSAADLIATI